MSNKVIILLFIFLVTWLIACTTEGCYENTESELNISLFETDDEEIEAIDSLSVYGMGMEDDLLYKEVSTSKISLPLFAGSEISRFVIINGLIYDTISVNYSSRYNYISKGCGYNFLHTIESVSFTKNRIDTILIINNSVSTGDEENLRTFF